MALFKKERPELGNFTVVQTKPGTSAIGITPATYNTAAQFVNLGTVNSDRAGGVDGLKVSTTNKITALTGTTTGINARANNSIDSSTGKIIGGKLYAANNNTSASLTVHGAEIWALTKGKNAATVRGAEIGLDFDGGETVTTAVVLRLISQAGGTVTDHFGLQIVDDSATTPGAKPFDTFIRIEKTATTAGKMLVDATNITTWSPVGTGYTAKDVPLIKYTDFDGTVHCMVAADATDTIVVRNIT